MWKGRKSAFAAVGRISPNYIVQDGVIPRSRDRARCCGRSASSRGEAGLRVANVFHAGDGNLHPLVLYDARVPGQESAAEELGGEILRMCVRYGGSITGEHGVGADKAAYMARDVPRGGPRHDGARPLRVRSRTTRFNPGQGLPDAAALRRPARRLPAAPGGARGRARWRRVTRDLRLAPPTARGRDPRHASGGGLRAGDRRRRPAESCADAARRDRRVAFVGGGTDLESRRAARARLDAVVATRDVSTASSSTRPRTRSSSSRRA